MLLRKHGEVEEQVVRVVTHGHDVAFVEDVAEARHALRELLNEIGSQLLEAGAWQTTREGGAQLELDDQLVTGNRKISRATEVIGHLEQDEALTAKFAIAVEVYLRGFERSKIRENKGVVPLVIFERTVGGMSLWTKKVISGLQIVHRS
jgi:hypothetical protein